MSDNTVATALRAPGQLPRSDLPRFGLPRYASRFPSAPDERTLELIAPDGVNNTVMLPCTSEPDNTGIERVTLQVTFHCVTTWSTPGLTWSGVRFADFFDMYLQPLCSVPNQIEQIVFVAQDGYKTSLPVADCLDESVLIADELDGHSLTIEHGAPLRLIAPKHYGYKNLKHLRRIELRTCARPIKRGIYHMLDHPRARVEFEERGRYLPGWLLRPLYRLFIPRTVKLFSRQLEHYNNERSNRRDK